MEGDEKGKDQAQTTARVKLCLVPHHFSSNTMLKEYKFVVIRYSNGADSEGMDTQDETIFVMQRFAKRSNITKEEGENAVNSSDDQSLPSQNLLVGSQSDTSSATSQSSKFMSHVREIKKIIELNHTPPSVTRFRANLLFFFLTMLITAVALLVVNLNSQKGFENYMDIVDNLKSIKNGVTRISIIYLQTFCFGNYPEKMDELDLKVHIQAPTLMDFF